MAKATQKENSATETIALDSKDLAILNLLQQNARMTVKEIAFPPRRCRPCTSMPWGRGSLKSSSRTLFCVVYYTEKEKPPLVDLELYITFFTQKYQ